MDEHEVEIIHAKALQGFLDRGLGLRPIFDLGGDFGSEVIRFARESGKGGSHLRFVIVSDGGIEMGVAHFKSLFHHAGSVLFLDLPKTKAKRRDFVPVIQFPFFV